ncbi:MAG: GNAT family N-acetyltransferase [Candidatus Bipolaricaulia bacterium]
MQSNCVTESKNLILKPMERKVPGRIGFHRAGRLRDYWKVNGEYWDRVLMDIIREEFYDENEQKLADTYVQTG